MGFRLKLREPLPDGLKRVFREQIDSALRLCQHPAKQRGVTVHEVRKHLKKLRAAMRLAVGEVGKNQHAREDRCVREIGRLVSDLRDTQVRLQTLIQLRDETAKGSGEDHFARIEELLSLERESFSAAFDGWQKQAIPKLERAGERLSEWPLDRITWKQICVQVMPSSGHFERRSPTRSSFGIASFCQPSNAAEKLSRSSDNNSSMRGNGFSSDFFAASRN